MTTLTAAQTAYLRAKSGDDCTPPVVSDALLQTYFDAANSDLACTIVSILEDRWAKVKAGASKVTDFGTAVDTSEMAHIKELMDYWRDQCGTLGQEMTVGNFLLDLDFNTDDLTLADTGLE